MADAVATAVGNAVKGNDSEASVQLGLETVEKIGRMRGALILRGRHMGMVGKLPELVRVEGGPGEDAEGRSVQRPLARQSCTIVMFIIAKLGA